MIQRIVVMSCCLFLLSCTDQSTNSGGNGGLVFSEDPFSVALGSSNDVTVRGGTGSIRVVSIDDSAIVLLDRGARAYQGTTIIQYFVISGKKLGTTKIHFADEQNTAIGTMIVTVMPMAASPSFIAVEQYRSSYTVMSGGTPPYQILVPPDTMVATAYLYDNEIIIAPERSGSTCMIIADHAVPPHLLSVPITVKSGQWFTSSGSVSISTDRFQITMDGILPVPTRSAGISSEGAGAYITADDRYSIEVEAYRVRPSGHIDLFMMLFTMKQLVAVPVNLKGLSGMESDVTVLIGENIDREEQFRNEYILTRGSGYLTTVNENRIAGTFSGYGRLLIGDNDPSMPEISVSNVTFDVPVLMRRSADAVFLPVAPEKIPNSQEELLRAMAKKLKRKISSR